MHLMLLTAPTPRTYPAAAVVTYHTLHTRRTHRIVPIFRWLDGEGCRVQLIDRELTFLKSAHSVDAIQRAVYRLSDRLSCDLTETENAFVCLVHIQADDRTEAESLLADFRNEVLDQTLRERIRADTELTRNLILSLAFSQTSLVQPEEGK
jgi:His-Xaa-Ser system protein HxsD